MSTTETTPATTAPKAAPVKKTGVALAQARNARRKSRKDRREKLAVKVRADKEFAKTFFGAKSKRSTDKKSAFRKKKARKK